MDKNTKKGKKMVLVVDEEKEMRQTVLALIKAGYIVESTDNARHALEKLDRPGVSYDALVIGTDFRVMTPQELACAAKSLEGQGGLSVICLGDGMERARGSVFTVIPRGFDRLHRELADAFAGR